MSATKITTGRQAIPWRAFLLSRLLVWAVAAAVVALFGTSSGGERFDDPFLTAPFGALGDALFSPLARWDAVWYLDVAHHGYSDPSSRAFFPLYPLLVAALAFGSSDPAALLVAAYVVSLACFLGALVLFHRLTALELGERHARGAVLLLALYPAALFFGAPYSESLFLLVSVGAFYAARTGHFAAAGALAGLASGTRSAGILLVLPLAVLWWRSEPRELRRLAWLGLAPLGLAAYTLYLHLEAGNAFGYLDQDAWYRSFEGPFAAVWQGAEAAFDGVRQLASGSTSPVYFERAGGHPFEVARRNITDFVFLVFTGLAVVGIWRRLPAAYGVWVTAALALPLSYPAGPQPLMSLPRFSAVLFPIFMWLALWCEERRVTRPAIAVSALLLALMSAQFAAWWWFA